MANLENIQSYISECRLEFLFLTAADEIDETRPEEGYEERYHRVKYVIDLSETFKETILYLQH
jgi:hypothetical protein